MNNLSYLVAALIIGVATSLQPPINAVMARILSSPLLAATISISISLLLVTVLWLFCGEGIVGLSQIKALPWWIVIGGIVGVVFVAGSIIVAPVLGVALFFVCVVAGQLLGSIIIDQVGAFGLTVKPVNTMKLFGLALVLIGATLVQNSK